MFKSLFLSAIFATAAMQALSEPHKPHDLSILPPDVAARVVHLQGYGNRFDAVINAIFVEWNKPSSAGGTHELDMSILPPKVATRVMELQKYGDRFDAAIRAIFIEAMKPSWVSKIAVTKQRISSTTYGAAKLD